MYKERYVSVHILDSPLILSVGTSGQKEAGRTQVVAEPYRKATRRPLMPTRKILQRSYGHHSNEVRHPLAAAIFKHERVIVDPTLKFGLQKKPNLGLTNKAA